MIQRIKWFLLASCFLATIAAATNHAWLNNNPHLILERQEITLSPVAIKVSYLIKNRSKQDIATHVTFPVQTRDASSVQVTVNGSAVTIPQQTMLSWKQLFPAHQVTLIEYHYAPVAQKAAQTPSMQNSLNALQHGAEMQQWLQQQAHANTSLYEISYTLQKNALSTKPIPNFTVKILKPRDGAVAFNPFYGAQAGVERNESRNFTLFISHFKPVHDLHVVYAVTGALVP